MHHLPRHAHRSLAAALLVACAPPPADPPAAGDGPTAPDGGDAGATGDPLPTGDEPGPADPHAVGDLGPATDFAAAGPRAVSKTSDTYSVNGCALAYDLYTPAGGASAPLVVLGHGFSRGRARMAAIAEHVASHGARVVTPGYCHSSLADADHEQNGLDAAALAAHLRGGAATVQVGYSAGGASAIVAAVHDDAAVGAMGLDAVDSGTLAQDAAGGLDLPVFGLAGKSNSCNSSNNGLPIYASAAQGWVYRLIDGGHCDFEDPTDYGCTLLCGSANAERQALVRALTAAFVAWATGLDPTGAAWILPGGSELEALITAGRLAPL